MSHQQAKKPRAARIHEAINSYGAVVVAAVLLVALSFHITQDPNSAFITTNALMLTLSWGALSVFFYVAAWIQTLLNPEKDG